MKKIFVIMIVLTICSTFLAPCGWAFWPFSSAEDKEQRIHDLENQIQIERQATNMAQQKVLKAENSFYLSIGFGTAGFLIALIMGSAMGSKVRKTPRRNNNGRNDNERE